MTAPTVYDFDVELLAGGRRSLSEYRGQVLVIVNTASRCGLAPQLGGLEALRSRFRAQGFEVLGFPCNQFAGQEPLGAEGIAQFCERSYGVTFPMHAKVDVNGGSAHPLFQHLKARARGVLGTEVIKWNYTKFLVGRDGEVVRRFGPRDPPEALIADIERLLARPRAQVNAA